MYFEPFTKAGEQAIREGIRFPHVEGKKGGEGVKLNFPGSIKLTLFFFHTLIIYYGSGQNSSICPMTNHD